MSTARETGPWVFSALVSAGVHVAAVAALVAAMPPLQAPAAPTEFVLDLLETPAQVEVGTATAAAVTPAVAVVTQPTAESAQSIAPDNLRPTRVESVAATTPQTQVASATPEMGTTADAVAIAGRAAITLPQAQAGKLEPTAGAPVPVTAIAALAGATGTPTTLETASALATMAASARAEAQADRPVAGVVVPTGSAASPLDPATGLPLPVTTTAAAAGASGTSSIVETTSAIAAMGATARAEPQVGSPIVGIAVPTQSAANPLDAATGLPLPVTATAAAAGAPGTSTIVETASALGPMSATARAEAQAGRPSAGAAVSTQSAANSVSAIGTVTAQSTAPVSGVQVLAQKPAAAVFAASVSTGTVGVPVNAGAETLPVVVGAQASVSTGIDPKGAAPVAVTAAVSASGAALAPLSPVIAVDGLDALDGFLARYDGGDCFAVLPERPGDGTIVLTAFAGSQDAAGAFLEALARDFGAAVPVESKAVSAEQCGALAFVRSSTLYPSFGLGLALDADVIAVGEPLSGEVLRMSERWLSLVVIDDEGRVSGLDSHVWREGKAIRFGAPVVPTGEAAGKTQLLLAVATAERLVTEPRDREPAQTFLAALANELSGRGIAAELAVSAFTVR